MYVCLQKHFVVSIFVACNVVTNTLYWSHSLGDRAKNDQMINQLGFSQSHVVVIDQSDACLQRLLSYPWVSKPEGNPSC